MAPQLRAFSKPFYILIELKAVKEKLFFSVFFESRAGQTRLELGEQTEDKEILKLQLTSVCRC